MSCTEFLRDRACASRVTGVSDDPDPSRGDSVDSRYAVEGVSGKESTLFAALCTLAESAQQDKRRPEASCDEWRLLYGLLLAGIVR